MDREKLDHFAVLPLRDVVLFPSTIVPLYVGRPKSVKAIKHSPQRRKVLLVAQKDPLEDDPSPSSLYKVGVVCSILQVLTLQDSLKVLVEGMQKVKVLKYYEEGDVIKAEIKPLRTIKSINNEETKSLKRAIVEKFEEYALLSKRISKDAFMNVKSVDDVIQLADLATSQMNLKISEKQQLLEQTNIISKLELLLTFLTGEVEALNTQNKIKVRVKNQIDKNNKDYLLNEQLKAIYKELGEEDSKSELQALENQIKSLKLEKHTLEKIQSEYKKLKMMNPMSSEAAAVRSYLDWCVEIPWQKHSKINTDIKKAESILDAEHYGLEKIKERILEYVAVHIRTKNLRSPILCLVGPPGVGKTSLAQSIAHATGREFAKISLGGLRDEAEIKGHRRTYIGAMPGKIIQALKRVKKSNPVILLDEIDKLGNDYRGDPSSALLEVLDPEQNHMFNDHYMEIDIDLSKVMFVATANSYNMPRPLLDRMEIVNISGYTEEEKMQIALNYLIPKQFAEHGINKGEVEITPEGIRHIIKHYTCEAGVRGLNRKIAKISRKIVKELLLIEDSSTKTQSKVKSLSKSRAKSFEFSEPLAKVDPEDLEKYLGVKKYNVYEISHDNLIGITNGLAYTEVGGDVLSIEAVKSFGKGDFQVTGKLGDVMKESVHTAISFIKSRAASFGIKPDIFKKLDIHVHVPEGAVPKDGPSAGVTMFTSLVSVLTETPVRKDVGMTGEITLRGRVLAIGGLKEKLLAALRSGIKKVLIPRENIPDLKELPDNVKEDLEIVGVEDVIEVLKHALVRMPKPIEWSLDQELRKAQLREEMHSSNHKLN